MNRPLPIGVLVSGEGTNLQALIDTVHGVEAEIVGVASDRPQAPALERAAAAGIPHAAFPLEPGEDRVARDLRIAEWISEQGAQVIVLAGYMQLVGPKFLSWFADAVINVHPSLLPAFPGLGAVEQALAYGVRVFGVSVHLVDEGIDTGPVILQRAVDLPGVYRPEQVIAALRPLEHALLPEAVRLFARGALSRDPSNPRRVLIAEG